MSTTMGPSDAAASARRSPSTPTVEAFSLLPTPARVFGAAVIGAGVVGLLAAVPMIQASQPGVLLELLVLAVVTGLVRVQLPLADRQATFSFSLSLAVTLATLIVQGTGAAVLIAVTSSVTQGLLRTDPPCRPHQLLFGVAGAILGVQAAGVAYGVVGGAATGFIPGVVRPLVAATSVYFLVNTTLLATHLALSTGGALAGAWTPSFLWSAPGHVIAAVIAAFGAFLCRVGNYYWIAIVSVPLYLTYRGFRSYMERLAEERAQVRQLYDVQLATVEALALAVEVKDGTSHAQVHRMQVYAEGLARAVGMREDDIPGVKTAALLHDIGHLAVPEHILSKPGPLTYEEFERVKIHPRIGREILSTVPFKYPVSDLILWHHERWDGTGYPDGLRGTATPLGARVLAVADTFTSLLFERPYRKSHSYGEALSILRDIAGTSLDPDVVETFIEILPRLELDLQRQQDVDRRAGESSEVDVSPVGPTALENILGAQREAKVLYEIAQALGTSLGVEETLRLIGAKLRGLLPFSCCALFLREPATGHYVCRVAVGTGDHEVMAIRGASLEWLSGTVPRSPTGEAPLCSVLIFPLFTGTDTLGALALYDVAADAYDHEHRRVLELVTRQAAPVIQNALVFEETQEASLTDPLTGLANRRALQQHLVRELARAERQHSKVAILLLDMDGLKYFNDEHGHHTGDRAIREVATVLRPLLRSYDLCARYAGDEFVIALWDCDAAQADVRRRELQDAVSASGLDVGRARLPLGVSAGAATYPDDGVSVEELLSIADKRMYRDKMARKHEGGALVPIRQPDPAAKAAG